MDQNGIKLVPEPKIIRKFPGMVYVCVCLSVCVCVCDRERMREREHARLRAGDPGASLP